MCGWPACQLGRRREAGGHPRQLCGTRCTAHVFRALWSRVSSSPSSSPPPPAAWASARRARLTGACPQAAPPPPARLLPQPPSPLPRASHRARPATAAATSCLAVACSCAAAAAAASTCPAASCICPAPAPWRTRGAELDRVAQTLPQHAAQAGLYQPAAVFNLRTIIGCSGTGGRPPKATRCAALRLWGGRQA